MGDIGKPLRRERREPFPEQVPEQEPSPELAPEEDPVLVPA
jgi:hypothetical protein